MSYISATTINDDVIVWERDEHGRQAIPYSAPYMFYVDDPDGKHKTIYGDSVTPIICTSERDFVSKKDRCKAEGFTLYEIDIEPHFRILSQVYFGKPAPKLHITFFDIEVNYDPAIGFSSIDNPYAEINSVSLFHEWSKQLVVFAIPPEDGWTEERLIAEMNIAVPEAPIPDEYNIKVVLCRTEAELLDNFLTEIEDSDVICGWNSDMFDTPYVGRRVEKRLGKRALTRLDFPEVKKLPWFRPVYSRKIRNKDGSAKIIGTTIEFAGRVRTDYMDLYKKYEPGEKASYKLSSIEQEVGLNLPKLEYQGNLHDLYRNNFPFFVRYNIRDTEILHGFEQTLGYVELANQMYHISTGLFKHVSGTLKLVEQSIINYCHHVLHQIVPNGNSSDEDRPIDGALVLYPQVSMQEFTGSIDINSLYPTAIQSINISPETLRGQFDEFATAVTEIFQKSFTMLTLRLETGETITKEASEWPQWLRDKKWSLSGYGTVFDQNQQGIIPAILANWYKQRKEYQKLMRGAITKGDKETANYYDRLQYVYKIKLNSTYGALTNINFRFFDLRMGESVTATGRMILRHQCRKVAEFLDGEYNVDFPQYETIKDTQDAGVPPELALFGPKFNGKFMCESVIYGDSVAGDTIIETDQGPKTIETLFTKINDVIGDKQYCTEVQHQTLTYDPRTRETTFRPIKYVVRHQVAKQMYRVWITNRQYVDVTEDHSLIAYKNTRERRKNDDDFLKEVTPQNIDSSLLYLPMIPHQGIIQQNIPDELFILMGYVMGDGHVDTQSTGGTLLSIGKQDLDIVCSTLLQSLRRLGWISSWTNKPNGHDVQISSAQLRKFLRLHLYTDNKKATPSWMFKETSQHIALFLRGFFSADGWTNNQGGIGITSVNEQHIRDIHRLLLFCGISSTWCTENTENSFRGVLSGTFSSRLHIKNEKLFLETIGFIQPRKIRPVTYGGGKQAALKHNLSFVKCQRVETLPIYQQYVYDIEVDDTHMFFANGILVHNTDSTYFMTHATTAADAVKIADRVALEVNNSYKPFVQEQFMCNPGFDDLVKCGRELVTDRGIFVDKKRYILHVVDKEGKPSDSMKVMGLDTKKTTLPRAVGDKLNNFIEMFLKGTPWENVAELIVEYKDALRSASKKDIMLIGLPKGIQGIEDYQDQYKRFGDSVRLPGHVAAAIHYNLLLKQYDDRQSTPIMSGMKIKVFYLNQTYGRFKSIALPTDIEVVPQWFLTEFEVDLDAHIERLIDNPLQNILKAIGKRPPTRHDLMVENVFGF
jgi:DNA polymerase elongation subunit (family B)